MFLKLKYIFIAFILLFITISFAAADAKEQLYDVAPAKGPVKFTFTLASSDLTTSMNLPYNLNYKGQDSYIAIIDTGIQTNHPFFQNRVVLEACFATSCPNGQTQMIGPGAAKPVHYHGTHVAGIAAGYSNTVHGVAPLANIIAINIFDSTGAAYDTNIVKALNWLSSISSQYNIVSVNMSIGGFQTYLTTCDDYIPAMTQAIQDLRSKNIATVISSGNSYAHGMSAPACISSAVSVAATYKTLPAKITNFSNINQYTTIAAPGSSIYSSKTSSTYGSASGTSMAAPFIAGAIAVYRSKFGIQSVDKIVSDFRSTSKRATDAYTGISIPYLNFDHLFGTDLSTTTTTSTTLPITTTTVNYSSTTLPISTTTSSSSTTTTLPITTTLPSTTTTTTSTTTTTTLPPTTTTLPPTTPLLRVVPPLVSEINSNFGNITKIYFRDPRVHFKNIAYYNLTCNDTLTYQVPMLTSPRWRAYNIPSKSIRHCYMTSMSKDGVSTAKSSTVSLYSVNKIITSSR